ncbi:MAG: hypothetical protein A3I05_02155 [Deltaproteobacteria bacterium RIFCSPLOWO2_02_FULL_44_10]|nr:MAG: hypothetical protein A3C46_08320 [Deltaproteobacteria bacterium RIFCSPHIGHO2_02_FULL_44_16]OGQ47581.1 MAG: hypothetical protein A3I05_02155 [Deltaproteobacteria bacterium RIFCSPLOWO2_02_FULL_44_10]
MNIDAKILFALQSLIPQHRGVFAISDLNNLFLTRTAVELQQKLTPFLKEKILYRICRGIYVTQNFDLEWLSQKICPHSAISFGSVLAKELVIGSIPQKTVYAAKKGKTRVYKTSLGQVVHLGFATAGNRLWFGYEMTKNGIQYADAEKAFLDTLYFYQKGHKFAFNIYSDIQAHRLDQKKLQHYLRQYKNPKFKTFVQGVLHGYDSI